MALQRLVKRHNMSTIADRSEISACMAEGQVFLSLHMACSLLADLEDWL